MLSLLTKLIIISSLINNNLCDNDNNWEESSPRYFNNIDIHIYRGNSPVRLLQAHTVNHEHLATELSIANATVPVLYAGSFHNLTRLMYIKMAAIRIETIEPGTFGYLPKLRSINLNFNRIRTIAKGVFNFLHISKLYLKGNVIATIEFGAFHNLTYLELLDLSQNQLQTMQLHVDMFKLNSGNLREIYLGYNQLRGQLPDGVFELGFSNNYATNDSIIDLSHNYIERVTSKTFNGLYGVKVLALNNNNISNVNDLFGGTLTFAESINLDGNSLTSLNDRTLNFLRLVSDIQLYGNAWSCTFLEKYKRWCVQNEKINTIDGDSYWNCNKLQ